jgi:hypothetical protein
MKKNVVKVSSNHFLRRIQKVMEVIEQTKEEEPKLTAKNFPKEIDIKFITNTYEEKVTETPFKLPSDLSRHGLSEIINHLLNHGK